MLWIRTAAFSSICQICGPKKELDFGYMPWITCGASFVVENDRDRSINEICILNRLFTLQTAKGTKRYGLYLSVPFLRYGWYLFGTIFILFVPLAVCSFSYASSSSVLFCIEVDSNTLKVK